MGRRVMLNLGSATDPYQPVEAERGFMRRLLPLLEAYGASIYACTKSTLVLRDLDLLAPYQHSGAASPLLRSTTPSARSSSHGAQA